MNNEMWVMYVYSPHYGYYINTGKYVTGNKPTAPAGCVWVRPWEVPG